MSTSLWRLFRTTVLLSLSVVPSAKGPLLENTTCSSNGTDPPNTRARAWHSAHLTNSRGATPTAGAHCCRQPFNCRATSSPLSSSPRRGTDAKSDLRPPPASPAQSHREIHEPHGDGPRPVLDPQGPHNPRLIRLITCKPGLMFEIDVHVIPHAPGDTKAKRQIRTQVTLASWVGVQSRRIGVTGCHDTLPLMPP